MGEQIRVVARRSGDWWAIEAPDHPGVFSQARRLDQVGAMAADALSLWLDRPLVPGDIVVEAHPEGQLEGVFKSALLARCAADEARNEATKAMRDAVAHGLHEGLPLRDIGWLLDVSHQRASEIARDLGAGTRRKEVSAGPAARDTSSLAAARYSRNASGRYVVKRSAVAAKKAARKRSKPATRRRK